MASIDIFNPSTGFDETLGFNTNWNYGSPRKPGDNFASSRPQYGSWGERAVNDDGYSFELTFVDRPIEQVRYIKRFFRQFKRGFFTLIDHDNNGRQHVGRFTKYEDDTHTANLKYTVKVTFEEIPGCAMQSYPTDIFNESIIVPVINDLGEYEAYTSGGVWDCPQTPAAVAAGTSILDTSSRELRCLNAPAAAFAQTEYVGWGFFMELRLSADLGVCDLYVDGVLSLQGIDLSTGDVANYAGGLYPLSLFVSSGSSGPSSLTVISYWIPLGRHRLKLVAQGANGSSSTASTVIFPMVKVIQ
ncbi:hypothetical protein ACFQBQ_07560 [Granulicella cerasi]|uniref:Uncharacterized protein n=1 Tax=Granulicella cerasi TaxID=741063 RepID=A0ABW1ZB75_9BACT|nr:hypothetical protein [Granulicella cerasi]